MLNFSFTIRPYAAHDIDDVVRVWCDGWRSTGLPTAVEANVADTMATMRARIPREIEAGWTLYVAEENERIVGMLALRSADKCLDQIFVDPIAQGRGIGKALMGFAKRQMPEGIWLRAAVDNIRACRWYKREGFTVERQEMHPILPQLMTYCRWDGTFKTTQSAAERFVRPAVVYRR